MSARRECREGHAPGAHLAGACEGLAVARLEQHRFAVSSAPPPRTHGVDDPASIQSVARSDLGAPNGATVERLAMSKEFWARH